MCTVQYARGSLHKYLFIYLCRYVPMPTHWIVNIMMGRFKGRGVEKHEGRCQHYYDEGFECYRNFLFICLPFSIRTIQYYYIIVGTNNSSKWNITVSIYIILVLAELHNHKVKSFMGITLKSTGRAFYFTAFNRLVFIKH